MDPSGKIISMLWVFILDLHFDCTFFSGKLTRVLELLLLLFLFYSLILALDHYYAIGHI